MSAMSTCVGSSFNPIPSVVLVTGPVKAALEALVRYMAAKLGPKCIRVYALSRGPLKTAPPPASNASTNFWSGCARTLEHRLVSIEGMGNLAAVVVSDGAAALTGRVEYIDAGYHIVG